jgi:tetratricopeptide (TPR) repeat protein
LLVRADNLFGPAYVLRLVHEQIELIESLLHDTRDDVRASLLSVGAQYAESAAWLHEDADDQLATFWTSRALEWAHASSDHRLVAWALFRRSQQAAREGNTAWSIGLARAAENTGRQLPNQMRAAFTQQEACGLALDGDETACQRKLDDALQWAAPEPDLHGDARSGHGAFCTVTYVELQRAHCWLQLRRPQRAVATYELALNDLPAAYHRDRGHGLAQFGSALVAANEPEHAASVTREALGIARGCGSGRTMHHIRTVGNSLRPHAELPAVAQLLDELAVTE